jgi:hypothetical protein
MWPSRSNRSSPSRSSYGTCRFKSTLPGLKPDHRPLSLSLSTPFSIALSLSLGKRRLLSA